MIKEEVSQRDKLEILRNERRLRTYHGRTQTDEQDYGGRFAKVTETTVTGTSPVQYPAQPSHSPWHCDPCGPEPLVDGSGEGNTFGIALGEPHEQRGDASAAAASAATGESGGLRPSGSATQQFKRGGSDDCTWRIT